MLERKNEGLISTANRIAAAAGVLLFICLFGEALNGRADLALAKSGQATARALLTLFEIAASAGAIAWMGLMLWVSFTPEREDVKQSDAQASIDARQAELEASVKNNLKA